LAACSAGIATIALAVRDASQSSESQAQAAPPSKLVHELSFKIGDKVVGDFANWLPTFLKTLLEKPGMLGAKVLASADTVPKPGVVFVLGGPGAGKGTQSSMIVEKYGYTHLSAGDLLRAERKSGSAQGQMIDEYIKEGKIVPVEVTVKLLQDAMNKTIAEDASKTRFLVDGFPRNTNNLSGWQQVVGDSAQVGGVLFYDCSEETMEARLLERGKTSGRSDDNIESIRKRFKTYTLETAPIIAYYDHQSLVHKIDGARPVEAVSADTDIAIAAIEGRFGRHYVVHIYANAGDMLATSAALISQVADAATKRFPGVVVSGRIFRVDASLKAFGIDNLPAFD